MWLAAAIAMPVGLHSDCLELQKTGAAGISPALERVWPGAVGQTGIFPAHLAFWICAGDAGICRRSLFTFLVVAGFVGQKTWNSSASVSHYCWVGFIDGFGKFGQRISGNICAKDFGAGRWGRQNHYLQRDIGGKPGDLWRPLVDSKIHAS